jgi:hypothetical protein
MRVIQSHLSRASLLLSWPLRTLHQHCRQTNRVASIVSAPPTTQASVALVSTTADQLVHNLGAWTVGQIWTTKEALLATPRSDNLLTEQQV